MTETAEARGQGCDMSLAKAKEFQIVTENFSVAIGLHGVVSRQGILCCDRVWPRPKGLVSQHNILCRDRVGQGHKFYVATEFGLGQGSCVATEYFMS